MTMDNDAPTISHPQRHHDDDGEEEVLFGSQGAPPDPQKTLEGGWRSWLVVAAATWCNGTIFGIQNSFGVLFVAMLERFGDRGDSSLRFKTAWVGSLSMGVIFLLSPLVAISSDRFGCCRTAVVGSVFALVGMISASFASSLGGLYVTYGLLFAAGCSMAYQPSLVILGRHFRRRLGLVNGLVTAGSSLFTIAMPMAIKGCLGAVGLAHTMQILSLFLVVLLGASCTYLPPGARYAGSQLPVPASLKDRIVYRARVLWELSRGDAAPPSPSPSSTSPASPRVSVSRRVSRCLRTLDWRVWRIPSYRIWAVGVPLALFGYFVPYVHLMKHVEERFPGVQGEILLICIGITSGVGRLVSGRVVDLIPGVNKVFLQVMSFVVMGLLSILLPLCPTWAALIVLCLAMGLVDGCFICVMAPIAFEIVGAHAASQAIGGLLGLMAVPMTAGPPIAGLLRDRLGSYDVAFYLAGVPPILGALVLGTVPWFHRQHLRQVTGSSPATPAGGPPPDSELALLSADRDQDPEIGTRRLDHEPERRREPDGRLKQEPDEKGDQEPEEKGDQEPDAEGVQEQEEKGDQEPDEKRDQVPDEKGDQESDEKEDQEPDEKGYQEPDGKGGQEPVEQGDQKQVEKGDQEQEKGDQEPDEKGDQEPDEKGDQKPDEKGDHEPEKDDQKPDEKGDQEPDEKGNQEPDEKGDQEADEKGDQEPDEKGDQEPNEKGESGTR